MKKILGVFAVAVFALVLTGCGKSNTLKCSIEESGMKVESTITFDGDKVTKVAVSMDLGSKEYAQQYAEFLDGQEGVKVKADGTKVVMTYTGDAATTEVPEGSKAEIKKALEEEGFKCN